MNQVGKRDFFEDASHGLITRVLAYALNYESGLELASELCTADDPAIRLNGQGRIAKWIDIGNPSPRRLHKAAKAADSVRVYTYKNPETLIREAQGENIHRAGEIEIFAFDPRFLDQLTPWLKRDNLWNLIHNEGEITVSSGESSISSTLTAHRLTGG